jgi:hypothetical protein
VRDLCALVLRGERHDVRLRRRKADDAELAQHDGERSRAFINAFLEREEGANVPSASRRQTVTSIEVCYHLLYSPVIPCFFTSLLQVMAFVYNSF